VSFQSEEYVGRVRKSAASLIIPTFALFVAAAVSSYFSNVATEQWVYYAILIACGLVAVLFWLVPVIRHLSFYLDITTSRITIRRGIFGGKTLDISWNQISEITFAKGRKVVIQQREGEAVELDGLPGPKKLATTLRSYL
jgi:membrane protein YdbS with pleckstrin-like domain